MPSLQKYSVKGKSYYRIVESKRVNGKPRAIPILHLGDAASLVSKLLENPHQGIGIKSYEHGGVAALKALCDELKISEIIDSHSDKSKRGSAIGDSIVLIAINRLLDPCSKRGIQDWAKQTSAHKVFPSLKIESLSSQFLWDQMHSVPESRVEEIESAILQNLQKQFDFSPEVLFYDTTNCYTYVEDDTKSELLQYGKSKEKQDNRRLFGVSLMVSRESKIPLCHYAYAGNKHDSTLFPRTIKMLVDRLSRLNVKKDTITLVFDKGFNSKYNFGIFNKENMGFVAALRVGDVPNENFNVPGRRFSTINSGNLAGLRYFRSKIILNDKEYTSVLYLSKNAREIQIRALNDQLASRLQELHDWQSALLNHESRRDSDTTAVNIRIQRIIGGSPFIREILSVSYDHTKPHEKRLSFSVNEEKKAEIIQNSFGRRILFTNRHDWNTLDIINTYFSQATVEQSFRDLKDDRSIAIRPQFHWTDHSIVIHVFTCYLALLLSRLLVIRAREVIPDISIHGCLTLLREIRLALLISKNQRKNICSWKLENSSVNALLLFNHLIAKH